MGIVGRMGGGEDQGLQVSATSGQLGPLLNRVDHVGIATSDLGGAIDSYREVFGVTVSHRETMVEDGMEVARLGLKDNSIYLLSPTDEDSGLAEFLENWGEGLHHVGYRTDNVASALQRLKDMDGIELIDTEPTLGFEGHTVAWVDATTVLGSLILLVEG